VTHRDSLGNEGTIHTGDAQWMTAGSGIMHEEMPHAGPRRLDGFQIWVNLPRKLKMTTPRYQDVPSARIPEVAAPGGARVRVIAGNVDGVEGAVREIFAGPSYLDVDLPAGAAFEQPIARGHTALLYVYRGQIDVAGKSVPSPRLAILGDGDVVRVRAPAANARFLVLSAQPLEEPAVRWGPFVMNTEAEIRQALWDLRQGTFVKTRPAAATMH
jgi:redox-sensitive bicupin YhaK (pirin superfamily)